jgi:hypothetical protein
MERQSTPTDGGPRGPDPPEDPLREPHGSRGPYEDPLRPPPRRASSFDPAALFVLLDGLRRVVPREL